MRKEWRIKEIQMRYEGWKAGKEIRLLRKQKGLTLEESSFRLGMSPSHINQLELGNRKMSIDLFYKLMDEFEVDANTILKIPTKKELERELSIGVLLESFPMEKRKYLENVFQYMINTMPNEE